MTVTAEGLRIELLESEKGTFFESGRPEPNANGKELLITLAHELGKIPNKISLEGHTDAQPYAGLANYSNWELSDRSRQRQPAPDAAERSARRSSGGGKRIRGPEAAETPRTRPIPPTEEFR